MIALSQLMQIELDAAVAAANRDWTTHARPIALAMIAMDAPAGLYSALGDVHMKRDVDSRCKTIDYREAISLFDVGRKQLLKTMEGIRDNYRCDHFRSYPMGTITEAEADEIEAYNEALDAGIVSVDAFLAQVERAV